MFTAHDIPVSNLCNVTATVWSLVLQRRPSDSASDRAWPTNGNEDLTADKSVSSVDFLSQELANKRTGLPHPAQGTFKPLFIEA